MVSLRFITGIIIFISAWMLCSFPVAAQSPSALDIEYEQLVASGHQSKENFHLYKSLAERGHRDSQHVMAYNHYLGLLATKSHAEAAIWYEKAADQGHKLAAFSLAAMHEKGEGVPKSSAAAELWYEKAAFLGHGDAMFRLGGKYYRGDGVAQSYTRAAYWFRQSANAGSAVGKMLIEDMEKNHPDAVRNMSRNGDLKTTTSPAASTFSAPPTAVKPRETAQQGFDAFGAGRYSVAKRILEPYANQGNGDAQNVLGIMYLDGLGVTQNNRRAETWFRKAANQGHVGGLYHLGAMIYYQRIPGGGNPYERAKSLLESASRKGYAPASELLVTMENNERARIQREQKEFDDSMDDIRLGRCRNPRYVMVKGREKVFCD